MRNDCVHMSYLEYYCEEIVTQIKEIDILIKSSRDRISVKKSAKVLGISEDELRGIMSLSNIHKLCCENFISVMKNGSSKICKLLRREIDRGSPMVYTLEDISYIYGIGINDLKRVCAELDVSMITTFNMPDVFARIEYIAKQH